MTNQRFWNNRYLENQTGWDLGKASPPLMEVIDGIKNKKAKILIPGCGNAYEVDYLLENGFTDITIIDIAPKLVESLEDKYANNKSVQLICGDFFEHQATYDVILEQTFFCAIDPELRPQYVTKMSELLGPKGKVLGVLFNRTFEKEGPPFGGNTEEYTTLFEKHFTVNFVAPKQSIPGREGFEVLIWAMNNKLNEN
jgi:SAM-dependent methyltransferase